MSTPIASLTLTVVPRLAEYLPTPPSTARFDAADDGCDVREDFRSFRVDRMEQLGLLHERLRDEPGKTLPGLLRADAAERCSGRSRTPGLSARAWRRRSAFKGRSRACNTRTGIKPALAA